MLKNLLKGIPLQTGNLSEGFVLANEVENIEYNKYAPIISAFRMDKQTFEMTINRADLFSQPIVSLNEILKEFPNIEAPNPIKTFNDVKISSLLHDSEQSQEINEIKNQLRHYLYSGLVKLEKVDYLIEVDKSKENFVTYYLFDPINYDLFQQELNKSLLEICKRWNDEEYARILKRIKELTSYTKSESAQKTSHYLDEVRFRFDEWFRNNGIMISPTIENKILLKQNEFVSISTPELKDLSYDDLLKLKEKFEILVQNHGEHTFHNIVTIKDIITDAEGDLTITYFFKRTKLKDLVEKNSGEKVFKDEFQSEKYKLSAKNLDFIKSTYEFYQSLIYRLHQITQEIHKIEFGKYSELPLIPINLSIKEDEEKLLKESKRKAVSDSKEISTKESFDRDMKEKCREYYEILLNNGSIDIKEKETKRIKKGNKEFNPNDELTKKKHPILVKIIPELQKKYHVDEKNIRTICDYFRQGYFKQKNKDGKISVIILRYR